jgi:hypothetical protein
MINKIRCVHGGTDSIGATLKSGTIQAVQKIAMHVQSFQQRHLNQGNSLEAPCSLLDMNICSVTIFNGAMDKLENIK